jgi:3',5'-cyclic AMP phosphodiesterase CpdA
MVKIVHVSDIHFGDTDPEVLAAALREVNALGADCVVVSGDLTQAGRRREFQEAARWLAGLTAPIVACPGNHDTPVYSLHSRLVRPFGRFRRLGLLDRWRQPEGRAAVVAFNSARAIQLRPDWSQGVWSMSDLFQAIEDAADGAPHGWRVIACHHPPVTPEGSPLLARTRNGVRGVQLLRRVARTIVLSGHVHKFTCTRRGDALLVTAPSLASSRERGDGLGFVVVDLDRDSGTVTRWTFRDGAFAADIAVGIETAPETGTPQPVSAEVLAAH